MSDEPVKKLDKLGAWKTQHQAAKGASYSAQAFSAQDEQIKANMERARIEAIVTRIIERRVPPAILNMPKEPPITAASGGAGASTGRDEDWFVGDFQGNCIWRKFPPTPRPDTSMEWSQYRIAGDKFLVRYGPIMWANESLNGTTGTDYEVSFASVTTLDERWLYVQFKTDTSYTPEVLLGANGYFPIDDPVNLIVRWRLSKWKFTKTTTDGVTTITLAKLATAWAGGCLHFPAIFGPP